LKSSSKGQGKADLAGTETKLVAMKTQTRKRLDDLIETCDCTTRVMEHGTAKAVKEGGLVFVSNHVQRT
jgi:hypothetical protein